MNLSLGLAQGLPPGWEEAIDLTDLPQDMTWVDRWKRLTYEVYEWNSAFQGTVVLETEIRDDSIQFTDRWEVNCAGRDGTRELRSIHKRNEQLEMTGLTFVVEADPKAGSREWCDSWLGVHVARFQGREYEWAVPNGTVHRAEWPALPQTMGLLYRRSMGLFCEPDQETLIRFVSLSTGIDVYRLSCSRLAHTQGSDSYSYRYVLKDYREQPRIELIVDDEGRLVEFLLNGRKRVLLVEAVPQ